MSQRISPVRRRFISVVFFGQLILLSGAVDFVAATSQQRRFPQPEIGLEIVLPNSLRSPLKFTVSNGGLSATLINR